jgi:hypothetical protein
MCAAEPPPTWARVGAPLVETHVLLHLQQAHTQRRGWLKLQLGIQA